MMTLIPVLIVAILFGVVYNNQYNQDLKKNLARLGKAYINQLVPLAQFSVQQQDPNVLQTLIDASNLNSEIRSVAVYNPQGQLLAYRGVQQHSRFVMPTAPGRSIVAKPLNRYTINFSAPIPASTLNPSASEPILGWLSIDVDSKFIMIKRYQMYIVTIFITLIGLLLGLLSHSMFSKRISVPIARLRRSMKQILSNEFETEILGSSRGELGIIEQGCKHLQQQYLYAMQDSNQQIELSTKDLQQSLELLEEKNIQMGLEKKKIEEKSRQKSEFIANLSHEIRTPMNGVIGFTNVLLESKLDPLQLDYVKTIKSSAQDLLSIINDILDYSKIDAGKLHLDCIPLNLRACIDEVLALQIPNANLKGVDLIPATAVDVPKTILGDPWRLKQIISNLVSNAIKFTDYGYVLIRTSITEETEQSYGICLAVTDTGIGISTEEQASLFNAFHQSEANSHRRSGGSGLGLVICKKLLEHMNGRIVITSEPHKGSTFSAYFKVDKLASYEIEKHQSSRFAGLKALCFDDNPLHLEALCNGLGHSGIDCVRVNAFQQLETAFIEHRDCDVAFINVNQGCEQQVAQVLLQQSMPCVLVSKWYIQDYLALGAQSLLFKPANIQKLQETIDSLLKHPVPKAFLSWPEPRNDLLSNELNELRTKLHQAKAKLLIAEDNAVNRMLLHSLLKNHATIETVEDGEQSVTVCDQQVFSIILLDLQMPKLNGLEAARRIRQRSVLNKHTPIILISANGRDLDQAPFHQAGIELCLQKPIEEKVLLKQLLTVLNKVKSSPIHWPTCVQKVSGNHALAVEFLARFVDELRLNREEFLEFYRQKDIANVERLAHKLHGACCFCGVPRLQQAVSTLETLAKHAQLIEELQEPFSQLLEAINDVLHEYERCYQPTFLPE